MSEPTLRQPSLTLRPWLVLLLLGAAWMLVILLTVKSLVPYAEDTTRDASRSESLDSNRIQTIQERVAPVE